MPSDQTTEERLREVIEQWRAEAKALKSDPEDITDWREGVIMERVCDRLDDVLRGEYP
jgi:hypothetical protein